MRLLWPCRWRLLLRPWLKYESFPALLAFSFSASSHEANFSFTSAKPASNSHSLHPASEATTSMATRSARIANSSFLNLDMAPIWIGQRYLSILWDMIRLERETFTYFVFVFLTLRNVVTSHHSNTAIFQTRGMMYIWLLHKGGWQKKGRLHKFVTDTGGRGPNPKNLTYVHVPYVASVFLGIAWPHTQSGRSLTPS